MQNNHDNVQMTTEQLLPGPSASTSSRPFGFGNMATPQLALPSFSVGSQLSPNSSLSLSTPQKSSSFRSMQQHQHPHQTFPSRMAKRALDHSPESTSMSMTQLKNTPSPRMRTNMRIRRVRASESDSEEEMKRRKPASSSLSPSPLSSHKPPLHVPFSFGLSAYHEETSRSQLQQEPDVERGLEALSRDGLLKLFKELIRNEPTLVHKIRDYMPLLSLDEARAEIQKLERLVLDAIPFGEVRDEYIWGRIASKLDIYINECGAMLNSLSPLDYSSTSMSTPAFNVAGKLLDADLAHPATTFDLLYATTQSVQRLENALPTSQNILIPVLGDTLSSTFIPQLFHMWSLFISRVANAVANGRIISASQIRQWINKIDYLYNLPSHKPTLSHEGLGSLRLNLLRELGEVIHMDRPDFIHSSDHNTSYSQISSLSFV